MNGGTNEPHGSQSVPAGDATTTVLTLLFTDLVDSCGLHERLGDEAMDELRRRHYHQLSRAIALAGGSEVKHLGDGVMAVFGSAVDAAHCAVAIQKSIESDGDQAPGLEVRVGLNSGEVTAEDDDYFGSAVNVASRLCQAAEGGQILASDLVRGLVGNRGRLHFERVGRLSLKGIAEPVVTWSVQWHGVEPAGAMHGEGDQLPPISAPLPAVLAQTVAPTFVGRAEDLLRLKGLWDEVASGRHRLAFIAGEPGIGKTRLCAEFAARVFADGGLVLYGHADEEAVIPYQPFVESLGDLISALPAHWRDELLRNAGDDLLRMTPGRRPRARSELPAEIDAETDRYRLFESVTAALVRISESRPVALFFDDMHWCGQALAAPAAPHRAIAEDVTSVDHRHLSRDRSGSAPPAL